MTSLQHRDFGSRMKTGYLHGHAYDSQTFKRCVPKQAAKVDDENNVGIVVYMKKLTPVST